MIYKIIATPRSGHVAITWWLASQLDNDYLGDAAHIHDASCGYSVQYTDQTMFLCLHHKNYRLLGDVYNRYNYLIKNGIVFIDCQSIDYCQPTLDKNEIIVLRDCYNTFASFIKINKNNSGRCLDLGIKYRDCWIKQATAIVNRQTPYILYNQWFTDISYRQQILTKLRLPQTNLSFWRVPHNGSGSSFNELEYDYYAYKMQVTTRWQSIEHENLYSEIINKECMDLNYEIFNMKPPGILSDYKPSVNYWRKIKNWWKQ